MTTVHRRVPISTKVANFNLQNDINCFLTVWSNLKLTSYLQNYKIEGDADGETQLKCSYLQ